MERDFLSPFNNCQGGSVPYPASCSMYGQFGHGIGGHGVSAVLCSVSGGKRDVRRPVRFAPGNHGCLPDCVNGSVGSPVGQRDAAVIHWPEYAVRRFFKTDGCGLCLYRERGRAECI